MTRDAFLAVLERHASIVDDEDERQLLATALHQALLSAPDATLIRRAFEHAPTSGARLIVMRELGGKREADVLDAAWRLAGGL